MDLQIRPSETSPPPRERLNMLYSDTPRETESPLTAVSLSKGASGRFVRQWVRLLHMGGAV